MKFKSILSMYCNYADTIVLGLTFLSLIWIFCYKFYWIDINPLFNNADRYADITYTILSSVVAAGLFYVFTIFIPEFKNKRIMINNLPLYLKNIDKFSKLIVDNITNKKTNEKYTMDTFKIALKDDRNSVFEDYRKSYNNETLIIAYNKTATFQKNMLEAIITNYSKSLPSNVVIHITDFCNIHFSTLQTDIPLNNLNTALLQFSFLENTIKISDQLKQDYNIKYNETIL